MSEPETTTPLLEVELPKTSIAATDLSKRYSQTLAVDHINLRVGKAAVRSRRVKCPVQALRCSFASVLACSASKVSPGAMSSTTKPRSVTSITARLV